MVTAAIKLKDTCSLEEKLWPTRQHIKKQRHYFTNKGLSSQSSGFSIVMYGGESWTIKKAEHQRTDAFELWCWRRLLRVPWTARRSNQSILKPWLPPLTPFLSLTLSSTLWCDSTLKSGCAHLIYFLTQAVLSGCLPWHILSRASPLPQLYPFLILTHFSLYSYIPRFILYLNRV